MVGSPACQMKTLCISSCCCVFVGVQLRWRIVVFFCHIKVCFGLLTLVAITSSFSTLPDSVIGPWKWKKKKIVNLNL